MKYIDTSAFVKYYTEEYSEKGSDEIKALINSAKAGNERLLTSVMLIGEAVSVFDKWVRTKLLNKDEFFKLLAEFVQDLKELLDNGGLVFEGINSQMVILALEYIIKYNLTLNDAFHLYCALANKDKIDLFVCCDKMLLSAAEKEELKIFNPENP